MKKKSSLLTRNSLSIVSSGNGKTRHVKSLKPQRTRQVIRRFHVLQKQKSSIFSILRRRWGVEVEETNYIQHLSEDPQLLHLYSASRTTTMKEVKLKTPPTIQFKETEEESRLVELLGQIDGEIERRGGLETYQTASTLGQTRGGDSSKKLMEWLSELPKPDAMAKPTALEIGCLSSQNAISTSGYFETVIRIDLRSQEKNLITQQDFMDRPLPTDDTERFDLISCSLVVNFVPTPVGRGDMLKKIVSFFKTPSAKVKPLLFLVLPLPCVANSRYLDNDKLDDIMKSLGFVKIRYYEAKKVAYWLWEWNGQCNARQFAKKELYNGSKRNNFCIVIE